MTAPDLLLPSHLDVVEVGLRDGLQSVEQPLPTDVKLQLIEHLVAAGCRTIEAVSFAHPRVLPQFADAEEVMRRVPRDTQATYRALVPNPRGARRALDVGVDEIVVLTCVDETISQLNQRRTIDEVLDDVAATVDLAAVTSTPVVAAVAMAFFAYGSGVTPYNKIERFVRRLHGIGIRALYIADSAGMADPLQVHRTLRQLGANFPDLRIGVHLHTRSGRALANTLAAMLAGTAWVETAFGGLGGDLWFPGELEVLGNTPTEDVLAMCEAMNVSTGIDPVLYRRVVELAAEATGRPSLAHVVRGGTRQEMSDVDWDALFRRSGRVIGSTSDGARA